MSRATEQEQDEGSDFFAVLADAVEDAPSRLKRRRGLDQRASGSKAQRKRKPKAVKLSMRVSEQCSADADQLVRERGLRSVAALFEQLVAIEKARSR